MNSQLRISFNLIFPKFAPWICTSSTNIPSPFPELFISHNLYSTFFFLYICRALGDNLSLHFFFMDTTCKSQATQLYLKLLYVAQHCHHVSAMNACRVCMGRHSQLVTGYIYVYIYIYVCMYVHTHTSLQLDQLFQLEQNLTMKIALAVFTMDTLPCLEA